MVDAAARNPALKRELGTAQAAAAEILEQIKKLRSQVTSKAAAEQESLKRALKAVDDLTEVLARHHAEDIAACSGQQSATSNLQPTSVNEAPKAVGSPQDPMQPCAPEEPKDRSQLGEPLCSGGVSQLPEPENFTIFTSREDPQKPDAAESLAPASLPQHIREEWFARLHREDGLDELVEAPLAVKADRDIMLSVLAIDGTLLEEAAVELQQDRFVVLTAVRQNGAALAFAAEALRKDREVAMAAVTSNGSSFQDAGFQDDPEVFHRALQTLGVRPKPHQSCREMALGAVAQQGELLRIFPEALRGDRDVVLAALHGGFGEALVYAPSLRSDREAVLAAVAVDGDHLELACSRLQEDRDVVLAAVRSRGRALRFAGQALRGDPEIVRSALEEDPGASEWVEKMPESGSVALHSLVSELVVVFSRGRADGSPSAPSGFARAVGDLLQTHAAFTGVSTMTVDPSGEEFSFCGPPERFSDETFACLGDCGMTCSVGPACSRRPPCAEQPGPHSCWRLAQRRLLQQAAEARGVMLMLVEREKARPGDFFARGPLGLQSGQAVEAKLAEAAGVRVFNVEMPNGWGAGKNLDLEPVLHGLAVQLGAWLKDGAES